MLPGPAPWKDIPERKTVWEGPHQETGFLRALGLLVAGRLETPAEGSSSLVYAVCVRVGFTMWFHVACALKGPGLV